MIMKKSLLLISLCVLAISASAQFKVQSDGKVAIQTTSTPVSPIAINSAGSSSYYMYCNAGVKNGFYLQAMGNGGDSGTNLGFRGHAENATVSVGVMGDAGSTSKAIGIMGSIGNTSTGAGIYGTIYGGYGTGISPGEKYAGFFYGNVKVTGNVIANNIASKTLLGESASASSPSASGLSIRSASVTTSLSGLNVTTYQKECPAPPEDMDIIYDLDCDTLRRGKEPEPDIIDVQYYEKTHYALDADRLEETFPDLVYVRKDGTKAINYMEMIPLLVQSINELSAEIAQLKRQTSEGTAKKTRSATNRQASSLHQNKLYQNTPNPFKEQTVIRFSLADDAQDAAICIFDMTGKTIKKLPVSSGMESVSIGGYELGEGMFLYSLVVNGQEIDTKKMIISK
jgi:hypothetical protein